MFIDIIIFAVGVGIFSYIIKDLFFKKEKTFAPIAPIIPVAKVEPVAEPVAKPVAPEMKAAKPKRKYGGKVKKTKSGMLGNAE